MTDHTPIDATEDSAWVTIPTPLRQAELLAFCQDIERLLRINPLWVFRDWENVGTDNYRLHLLNESNTQEVETDVRVEHFAEGFHLHFGDGIKRRTTVRIEPGETGASIILTDDYGGIEQAEREARADDVDKSLIPWGNAIQHYLVQWRRWSWFAPWRYYMRRIWQPMKPSARRIVFMITLITALEFIAFLLVFAIFWLELDQFFEL